MTKTIDQARLRSGSTVAKVSGRDRPATYIKLVPNTQSTTSDALNLFSTELGNNRPPLAYSGGADTQRPRDIRGALKVINNVLFQHDTSFTTVKRRMQPKYQPGGLTSVDMDKYATIADRLNSAIEEAGVSPSQLARDCRVSPAAVHKWQNGGKLSADNSATAARALGVREEWLRTGKLPRERENATQEEGVDRVVSILQGLREPLAALAAAIDQLGQSPSEPRKKRGKA